MQRLEVSGAVRPIYGSLGVKRLRVIPDKGRGIFDDAVFSGVWVSKAVCCFETSGKDKPVRKRHIPQERIP